MEYLYFLFLIPAFLGLVRTSVTNSFVFLSHLLVEMFSASVLFRGFARHMPLIFTFLDLTFIVLFSAALWVVSNLMM